MRCFRRHLDWQIPAADSLKQTESLFADQREPFFNTIGQKPQGSRRAKDFRFAPDSRHQSGHIWMAAVQPTGTTCTDTSMR
jgi:hypothetical protein